MKEYWEILLPDGRKTHIMGRKTKDAAYSLARACLKDGWKSVGVWHCTTVDGRTGKTHVPKVEWEAPKEPVPRKALIIEIPNRDNGWRYLVLDEYGTWYRMAGIGAPQGGQVGDQGTLGYQSGSNFGLWFWTKN